MREVDFTKKRLQQEFEDKLEVEQQSKRQLERRVRLVQGVEARAWEGQGGAWHHVLAYGMAGEPGREALGKG